MIQSLPFSLLMYRIVVAIQDSQPISGLTFSRAVLGNAPPRRYLVQ